MDGDGTRPCHHHLVVDANQFHVGHADDAGTPRRERLRGHLVEQDHAVTGDGQQRGCIAARRTGAHYCDIVKVTHVLSG